MRGLAWRRAGRKQHTARPRGVSLLEVMVAMLLLSVGMLGMLGLKMAGLRSTAQANVRATASMHATNIMDRMRANPVRALAGEYTLTMAGAAPAVPVGVAQVDLAQWRRNITDDLPGGSGSVAVQPDGTVQVVLQWNERSDASNTPTALSFTFEARL